MLSNFRTKMFPRTLLKWREPKHVGRVVEVAEEKAIKWWLRPTGALLIAVCFMSVWLLAKLNPNKTPPPFWQMTLIALAGGAFFVYVIPKLSGLFPRWIILRESGIQFQTGGTVWITYDNIERCMITSIEIDGASFPALVVLMKKGGKRVAGIDEKVSLEEVENVLRDCGVEVEVEAHG